MPSFKTRVSNAMLFERCFGPISSKTQLRLEVHSNGKADPDIKLARYIIQGSLNSRKKQKNVIRETTNPPKATIFKTEFFWNLSARVPLNNPKSTIGTV